MTVTTPVKRASVLAMTLAVLGGCDPGPRIEARPQTITFGPAPSPTVNEASATVVATASSGLPVGYGTTSSTCTVDVESGVVTATAAGTCTVTANQPGDARYAAAPQVTQDVTFVFSGVIVFGSAPVMAVYDRATVTATESAGAAIRYETTTPAICSVDAATGVVDAVATGDCTVVASAGAATATQVIAVAPPSAPTAPDAPTVVTASAGDLSGTVRVGVGAVRAGGSPIIAWAITSTPAGLSATGTTLPVTVDCPSSCAGYRFSAAATNAVGTGPVSAPSDVITRYRVVAVFREPDTQPNDSIFVGTFALDSSAGQVSGLAGRLSESMTGGPTGYPNDTMTWIALGHQLSAVPVTLDGAAGWLVTAFRLDTMGTLSQDPRFGGTDGWEPGSGTGLHFGYPGANPGNAYARIFVNTADPTASPTAAQLDKLAYADCTPGGMMGASCMTGTSVAGYGTAGTMGGYPASQSTTRDPGR